MSTSLFFPPYKSIKIDAIDLPRELDGVERDVKKYFRELDQYSDSQCLDTNGGDGRFDVMDALAAVGHLGGVTQKENIGIGLGAFQDIFSDKYSQNNLYIDFVMGRVGVSTSAPAEDDTAAEPEEDGVDLRELALGINLSETWGLGSQEDPLSLTLSDFIHQLGEPTSREDDAFGGMVRWDNDRMAIAIYSDGQIQDIRFESGNNWRLEDYGVGIGTTAEFLFSNLGEPDHLNKIEGGYEMAVYPTEGFSFALDGSRGEDPANRPVTQIIVFEPRDP